MGFQKPGGQGIYLDQIEIIFPKTSKELIQVVLRGNLANPCLKIDEPEVDLEGTTFHIALKTVSTAEACIQMLEPFEKKIPIEVGDLPAGVYTIDVLGQRKIFEWKNGE